MVGADNWVKCTQYALDLRQQISLSQTGEEDRDKEALGLFLHSRMKLILDSCHVNQRAILAANWLALVITCLSLNPLECNSLEQSGRPCCSLLVRKSELNGTTLLQKVLVAEILRCVERESSCQRLGLALSLLARRQVKIKVGTHRIHFVNIPL